MAEPSYEFATPLFGLALRAGAACWSPTPAPAMVKLQGGEGALIAELPEDHRCRTRTTPALDARGDRRRETAGCYRVKDGVVRRRADLGPFEADVNPDGGEIDSNAFDVAKLPDGRALVADAAANALLFVRKDGHGQLGRDAAGRARVDRQREDLVGCPYAEPGLGPGDCDCPGGPRRGRGDQRRGGSRRCVLRGRAQGLPCSDRSVEGVADRARERDTPVRREPPACSVVADGFTSVIDLGFGRDGALHVVEFDEASWFAVELGQPIGRDRQRV